MIEIQYDHPQYDLRFLSLFYPTVIEYKIRTNERSDGEQRLMFTSAAQLFFWLKTKHVEARQIILGLTNASPFELAQASKDFPVRSDWLEARDNLMMKVNQCKYVQSSVLCRRLVATGNQELVNFDQGLIEPYFEFDPKNPTVDPYGLTLMRLRESQMLARKSNRRLLDSSE